jgi:hypothetical protein
MSLFRVAALLVMCGLAFSAVFEIFPEKERPEGRDCECGFYTWSIAL